MLAEALFFTVRKISTMARDKFQRVCIDLTEIDPLRRSDIPRLNAYPATPRILAQVDDKITLFVDLSLLQLTCV